VLRHLCQSACGGPRHQQHECTHGIVLLPRAPTVPTTSTGFLRPTGAISFQCSWVRRPSGDERNSLEGGSNGYVKNDGQAENVTQGELVEWTSVTPDYLRACRFRCSAAALVGCRYWRRLPRSAGESLWICRQRHAAAESRVPVMIKPDDGAEILAAAGRLWPEIFMPTASPCASWAWFRREDMQPAAGAIGAGVYAIAWAFGPRPYA